MLEAKSMYFGGDIIFAKECNYESYVRLGLKCPFCDCAVFLRSASIRVTNGIEKPITAYFAHFPSGSDERWDCEARSKTKTGREEIEQVRTEARNQRLKIYNDKLWQMIKNDSEITKEYMTWASKDISGKWLTDFAKLVKKEISQNFKQFYDAIDLNTYELDLRLIQIIGNSHPDLLKKFKEKNSKRNNYFEDCDKRLHKAICCEIIEFLMTPSGTWTFNKILTFCCHMEMKTNESDTSREAVKELRETISPYQCAKTLFGYISDIHWIKAIDRANKKI